MNEKKNDTVSTIVLFIGAGILFSKTADVMGYFAPAWVSAFLGFDASMYYGWLCAALVEGEVLALHMHPNADKYTPAQWVKWILLLISLFCQFFDGTIVTNTLSHQSAQIKAMFQFGVPAVPAIVVVMIIIMGKIPNTTTPRKTWRGLKSYFDELPKIWHGENYKPASKVTTTPMQTLGMETPAPELAEKTKNPTFGSNGKM